MRFLIIGDLHGDKPNIYLKKSEFDAIIFPGDVCSDKKTRELSNYWVKSWGTSKTPYLDWEKFVEGYGRDKLDKLEEEEVKVGNKILKFLDKFGKPIFFIPGNWDQSYGKSKIKDGDEDKSSFHRAKKNLDLLYGTTNKNLKKGVKNLVDCQFKLHKFSEFNILGYGTTNFPERPRIKKIKDLKKRKIVQKTYDKIANKLKKEYKRRNKSKPTIFLSHNMPYMTKMDKIIKKGSPVDGMHYGSNISKEFIKENQPLICIGAHMHEYLGKQKIGRTTLINAGFGPKVNTLLDIKNGKIKRLKFIKKDRRKKFNKKVGW